MIDFGEWLRTQAVGEDEDLTLTAREIVGFAEQMVSALAAVHSSGVVHCDLKPTNLVLVLLEPEAAERDPKTGRRRDGSPENYPVQMLKLCDFGVARELVGDTHLTEDYGWGTIKYMAPEMVHSDAEDGRLRVGRAVDVWALGVVRCYVVLCG